MNRALEQMVVLLGMLVTYFGMTLPASIQATIDAYLRLSLAQDQVRPPPGQQYDDKGNPVPVPGHGGTPRHPEGESAEGGFFPYRPGGYSRILGEAGDEWILNRQQMSDLQSASGGPQTIVVPISIGGQKLDEIIIRRKGAGYYGQTGL